MANWRVDDKGRKRPKKLKRTVAGEREIERTVQRNPELLEHKDGIVSFENIPNTAGDLLGLDKKGRFVLVEFKRRLGEAEEAKASRQVRIVARRLHEYTEERIQWAYARLCRHKYMKGLKQHKEFKKQFKKIHGRELKTIKDDRVPSAYVVADYATTKGLAAIRRKSKRRKKEITYISIQFLRKEKSGYIFSVQKLA